MAGPRPEAGRRVQGRARLLPGCGLQDRFKDGYLPYAPTLVLSGDADEEVSTERCVRLVAASRAKGGDIRITVYPGATHDFDDPGEKRQGVPANAAATKDAIRQAGEFVAALVK